MATLDPEDWSSLRALGHRMMDDMIDHLETVRERPVWRPVPDAVRTELRDGALPREGRDPAAIYADFQRLIEPYPTGNTHPRFMGWVHGGGNAVGMLGELLASGLNSNLGGRDHAPIEVEREVVRWAAEMVGMPATSSGLLVTGSSMANLIAVLTARRAVLGDAVRREGIGAARLTGYAGRTAHGCIPRAFDIAGLGTDALRLVPTDDAHRVDIAAIERAISRDRDAGLTPFMIVGSAGTVDCGAVDDLAALADLAARHELWFHVDGAFGALARVSPRYRDLFDGIERADSLAFDFHKWAQVPYDAGCVLVRDQARQTDAFAQSLAYLRWGARGLAGGGPWPCDLGPELSRGFRALKVWMTLQAFGTAGLADVVDDCCDVAQHLAARIRREPDLELLAPVALNIVCFGVRGDLGDEADERVADLQEAGIAAPSTTTIGGRRAIRAAIVNHRTTRDDADALVDALLAAHARVGVLAGD